MGARKRPEDWSPSYRKRMEREQARAQAEGRRVNRTAARGHGTSGAQEYQKRKASERARAGKFHPLTPAQIRQLRRFGAKDEDLQAAAALPRGVRERILKEQRARARNPAYAGDWTIEDMADLFPDVPPVMFYYHSAWRG